MQSATTHTPKTSYSPACYVTGCIDLNKKLEDAIRERGQQHPEEHAPMHDNPDMRDCALFYLHPFDNYIMGPVQQIGCGCEIRGGGNLISPLHVHHCKLHATTYPTQGYNEEHGCIVLVFEPADVLIALGLEESDANLAKAKEVYEENGEKITDALLEGWSEQMGAALSCLDVEAAQFPDQDDEEEGGAA